jgi:uncharacterized DUF497 family protein
VQYNFEWDPAKARENLRKHKISFERASQIFLDALAISIPDEEHSEDEERWTTIGKNGGGTLLVLIHTFREIDAENFNVRLISARKATKREEKEYSTR